MVLRCCDAVENWTARHRQPWVARETRTERQCLDRPRPRRWKASSYGEDLLGGVRLSDPSAPGVHLAPVPETAPDASEPTRTVGVGRVIGYGRDSRTRYRDHTHPERQRRTLLEAGCEQVFIDRAHVKAVPLRPEFDACLSCLAPGDVLVVVQLDRLTRSLPQLIETVGRLFDRGIGFRSLCEDLDTTSPGGRFVFHVFAALAQFMRELNTDQPASHAAQSRGGRPGRPRVLRPDQIAEARRMLPNPENSVASIARFLGVSRSTLYKQLPELSGRHAPVAAASSPDDDRS